MKYLLLATSILLSIMASRAQTTREVMLDNRLLCTGLYIPYPDSLAPATPVPEGYTPFYVSHYGRHGSRYLASESDYSKLLAIMTNARDNDNLTQRGIEVYNIVADACKQADRRAGQLAPLGYEQQRDIAARLVVECPQVFDDNSHVTAVSTIFMRCAHSMFAFVAELQRSFPGLEVPIESSERNMYYLSATNQDANNFYARKDYQSGFDAFRGKVIHPHRLLAQLLKDPGKLQADGSDFMWQLYMLAIDLPNTGGSETLLEIFTPEELFNLWQVLNYEYYTLHSGNPDNGGVFLESVKELLKNIVLTADQYIAQGEHGATLRFGHDSSVIPLAALLQFPVAAGKESNPTQLYKVYADYRVSPMAANIQVRFYRNDSGNILVKFMLNEQEMPLAGTSSSDFPYYKWNDVRAILINILDTPPMKN